MSSRAEILKTCMTVKFKGGSIRVCISITNSKKRNKIIIIIPIIKQKNIQYDKI
jgi:hypothetical protein